MSIQTPTINWNLVSTVPKPPKPEPGTPATPCHCLITHRNGELKVYGPKNLRTLILNLPSGDGVENELTVKELLDEILRPGFRDIFWPGCMVAGGWLNSLSLEALIQRTSKIQAQSAILASLPLNARRSVLEAMTA